MGKQQPGDLVLEKYIAEPRSIDETRLSMGFLADLVLKLLYYKSDVSSAEIGDILALPFVGVPDKVLEFIKREELVEISGSRGLTKSSFTRSCKGSALLGTWNCLWRPLSI